MAAPAPAALPQTMRSLHITKYTTPSNFQVAPVPVPTLANPTDVLIRCKAASLNPGDLKLASGAFHFMSPSKFPYKLCLDVSGTVVAVGDGVDLATSKIQIGDDVYTQLPLAYTGGASEYATCPLALLAHKPPSLSHTQAAALPMVFFTAHEMAERAAAALRALGHPEGLKGKTVFVSGGLSGTGAAVAQVAKHVHGAARVVVSVSTGKVRLVGEMLPPGTVDVVFDYQTEDIAGEAFRAKIRGEGEGEGEEGGKVDVYFDAVGTVMQRGHLGLIKKGGIVVTITSLVKGAEMEKLMRPPWLVGKIMDLVFAFNSWRAWRYGVGWHAVLAVVGSKEDMDVISGWIEEGKVRPVIGKTVKLDELDKVIEFCEIVKSGKGGVGKFVIEVD